MGRRRSSPVFFFNDTATTEIYTLSLHDALPISSRVPAFPPCLPWSRWQRAGSRCAAPCGSTPWSLSATSSQEHTSELQSRLHLVCRLLLEKKKKDKQPYSLS